MWQLAKSHAKKYTVGLHPSWQTGDEKILLKKEKEELELMSEKTITISRQHYIRFNLPEGYRNLVEAGIKDDYSMGYGSINGFRASVASSFLWYDLEKGEQATLRIHPFCFMDANSYYEQGYNAARAMQELMHYYNHTSKVNGLMVTIWHNHFLGTDPRFAGWRDAYKIFLTEEIYWGL